MDPIEAMRASAELSNAAARRAGWMPQHGFGEGAKNEGSGRKKIADDDEIMRLRDEGLTYLEIGQRLGMTKSGVTSRVLKIQRETAQDA